MKSLEADFLASGDFLDFCGPVSESIRILAEAEALEEFRGVRCVLAYMSIPGEVDTRRFVDYWRSAGKRMVLPLVCGDSLELREYDPERVRSGYRGIIEPSADAVAVDPAEVAFALIPGTAFSFSKGLDGVDRYYRMGRGGGFYDRLLPLLSCPVAGVCFPFRFLDSIPVDQWDRPVDMVLR